MIVAYLLFHLGAGEFKVIYYVHGEELVYNIASGAIKIADFSQCCEGTARLVTLSSLLLFPFVSFFARFSFLLLSQEEEYNKPHIAIQSCSFFSRLGYKKNYKH